MNDATSFAVEDSQVTHNGMLTTLRVDTLRMPDGATARREIAERPNAVAMVALAAGDGGDEVVLVRQYRHALGAHELELPAGLLDVEGEAERDAAQRELAEEVGVRAGHLRHLLTFHNSSGWSDEATSVYLATDLAPAERPQGFVAEHEEADMAVVRMPLAEALAAVRRGEISDAKTVIGLLLVAAGAAS